MVRSVWLVALFSAAALGQLRVDVNVDLGRYFRRSPAEIVVLGRSRIPEDELPVVLFIATRANVGAEVIWRHRQSGMGWWDISARYGLSPDVFYVPLRAEPGPPYGRAYGYYKRPRSQWHNIRLSDDDVVNLVNLRFLSDHYGYAPERIVRWRSEGRPFVRIHEVAEREHWKEQKERWKDEREAWKEREKDQREADREREKDRSERRKNN